jgi:hypothetical protein
MKKSQKSLADWTKEDWGTKSGKPSTQGQRLQENAIFLRVLENLCHQQSMPLRLQRKEKTQKKASNFQSNLKRLQRKLLAIGLVQVVLLLCNAKSKALLIYNNFSNSTGLYFNRL